MTKGIVICFFIALNLTVTAQTNASWLSYLKSIKDQFYLQDTIVFSFKVMNENEYAKYLKPVKVDDCAKFFKLQWDLDDCDRGNEKFFYSYHLSEKHFATLTFFSFGKFTPVLTLYNYSPKGELLKRIEVKSDFMDAGEADSTVTHFINDSTFLVRRWDGYEASENGKSVLVDSITKTNYLIKPSGRIDQGTQRNHRRTK